MKLKNLFLGIGMVLILALVPLASVQAGKSRTLSLDWRQVIPSGSGNPNMFGDATIDVNAGQARLCYTMRVFVYPAGTDWPPTAAGIHRAPAGSNGPLVVDLDPDWDPLGKPNVSGCLSIDSGLAHDIQRNPSQYYLLVSDSSHPDGAARAQLTK